MKNKPQILYISSASPVKGPGAIGLEHVRLLKEAGYEVDMLTLYKEQSVPDIMYVKNRGLLTRLNEKIRRTFIIRLPGRPHCFFYKKETDPPIPTHKIIKKIVKPYDLVIVYFWQGLLSFKTVEAIYDMLNHPVVFFLCPDYSHMSGGCHFTCNCMRYQTGCGCCPAINSKNENDFTHWNVQYRMRFYEKVKPIVFGNNYMNSFYQKSFLLKNVRTYIYSPTFNIDKFHAIDKSLAQDKMGISNKDAFIIAFGCQDLSDSRKGIPYLIKALELFKARLTEQESSRILLLVAGSDYEKIKSKFPFPSIGTGFLPVESLPFFYSAANVFVCSSVDDAGPSMVGQSIACGTPVVGFKMGAMLDSVMDKGTGYCAELRNSEDLANGIDCFYHMSEARYEAISKRCRQFAIENSSLDAKVAKWMDLYERYRDL